MSTPRTSIVISNLDKQDFVAEAGSQLSLANQIKLALLNLPWKSTDFIYEITYWSALPTLSRIIVMFKSEEAASVAYEYLRSPTEPLSLPERIKVSLQQNLLLRSKLQDALHESSELAVTKSLANFRNSFNKGNEYIEPEPQHFDALNDLARMGVDVTSFNSEEQLLELSSSSPSLGSSGSGIGRLRSLTRTLFRPEPMVDTSKNTDVAPPPSPTITLDGTF